MADDFDFDSLKHLAETDPQAYFAERSRLIEAFLAGVPDSRREQMRHFQSGIDAARASAGTPAKAVETLMGMLSDHIDALLGQTMNLAGEARALHAASLAGG